MRFTVTSFFLTALNSPFFFLLENAMLQVLGSDIQRLQKEAEGQQNEKMSKF